MHPYDILEDPSVSVNRAREAIEELVFEMKENPDPVSNSFNTAEKNGLDPDLLLDDVARSRLNHMYTHRRNNANYPSLLFNWKGDATKGTPELLDIARGEDHPDKSEIEQYQRDMRSNLPTKIPLVRGGSHNNEPLES